MSQRNSTYIRKKRDLYETPEWVTEALLPHLPAVCLIMEPAAGTGKMVRILERDAKVWAQDIEPDPCLHAVGDFRQSTISTSCGVCHGIVTNPPFELATEFIEHALRLTEPVNGFVAMLLRTDFDHAKSRTHLFRDCPAFSKKLVLMKRIVWFVEDDGKPKASPSYNHAWFLWNHQHEGQPTLAYAA